MRLLVRVLYAAVARLTSVAAALVPISDSKTAIALRARRGIRSRYATWAAASRDTSRPLVWIHATSVGEGLQARPVMSLLRARRPDVQLAYTFFSPSAEEFSRTLDADFRDYLPFDAWSEMGAVLDALRPGALVFSKVDVWPELVRQAHSRGVRLGMISATLAAASGRRGFAADLLLRDAYRCFDAVGAVDQADAERLMAIGVRHEVIEVTGDTRFDQVWQRAQAVDRHSGLIARLSSERPTIVAGSTWPTDEDPLLDAFARVREKLGGEPRMILAPHEPTAAHIEPIEHWARQRSVSTARVDLPESEGADLILVDRFGVLGDLYALADVAFVGGGFHDAGLHSVLEPAAFGAPVIFGPKHRRSRDALLLLDAGGARAVRGAADIEQALLEWLRGAVVRRIAGARARELVERNRGAAERSFALVEKLIGEKSVALRP